MKGGIVFSDALTTVSPTYAKEILLLEYGCGLEGVLRKYKYKLKGILNGIDYEVWDPATDTYIWQNYSVETLESRFKNKQNLCAQFGLNPELPLVSFIGRLSYQKGVHWMLEAVKDIARLPINLFVLGSGEYEKKFKEIDGHFSNIKTFYWLQ